MSESKKKTQRRRVGDIFQVPLTGGKIGLGIVLEGSLYGFFDWIGPAGTSVEIDSLLSRPLLFRIWVMRYAITSGMWRIIGRLTELRADWTAPMPSYKFDTIAKLWSVYDAANDVETPATFEECKHMECAAVWEPEHVASRIEDHFAGRPNVWVEMLRAETKAKKHGLL